MAEARAEVIITAKDNASATIKALSRNIQLAYRDQIEAQRSANRAAQAEINSLARQIELKYADQVRMQELVKQSIGNLSEASKRAGMALLGAAAAGGALIANTTLLAARVETLGIVLETVGKNAGYSKEQIAGFEEAVKKQGITTQAARDSLILMAQANLDLSRSADLARIAQDAAVIAGINSSEAFRRMAIGINQLDPLILRNLGLVVDLGVAYKRFADEQGRSVFSITGAEKRMIALNEVVRAGVGIAGSYEAAMGTAGKQMTSLARHVEEARLAIGEAFLPTFSAVIVKTTDGLKVFNELGSSTKVAAGEFLGLHTGMALAAGGMLVAIPKVVELATQVDKLSTSIATIRLGGGLAAGFVNALPVIGAVTAGVMLAMEVNQAYRLELAKSEDAFRDQEAAIRASAETYAEYRDRVNQVAREHGLLVDEYGNLVRVVRGEGGRAIVEAGVALSESGFQAQFFGEKMDEAARAMGRYQGAASEAAPIVEDLAEVNQRLRDSIEKLHEPSLALADAIGSQVMAGIQAAGLEGARLDAVLIALSGTFAGNQAEAEQMRLKVKAATDEFLRTGDVEAFRAKLLEIHSAFNGVESSAEAAKRMVEQLGGAIGSLQSKDITITTRFVTIGGLPTSEFGALSGAQQAAAIDVIEAVRRPTSTTPRTPPPPAPTPAPPTPRERRQDRLFRQHGGPVMAGQSYIVGEAGPEWFMPRQSGAIVPGAGGVRLSLNVPLYLDGREIGRAAYDGLVEEARARGMRLMPVA